MGKKYSVEDDMAIVEFCLNCTKSKCYGTCEELKAHKRKIAKKEQSKTRGDKK